MRFEEFEIRVEPKLAAGDLGLFRMIEFTTGLGAIRSLRGAPKLLARGGSLLDLIAHLLVGATERVMRAGLRADYIEREENLPVLRGRLLYERQLLERFGQIDRLICRYDDHEHDIADNRLLALALAKCARVVTDPAVRRHSQYLEAMFAELCDRDAFDVRAGRSAIEYNRLNEHYREAHELSWLMIENLGPDDLLMRGPARSYSFLINMNLLFETFVCRLLGEIMEPATYVIDSQRGSSSIVWRMDLHQTHGRIIPDLVIRRRQQSHARLPVDSKFKPYDTRVIDSSDIAQCFLYAYAYRNPHSLDMPNAVIVYPSSRKGEPAVLPLEVRSEADQVARAEIGAIGIHIPTALEEVRKDDRPALETLAEILKARVPDVP